MIIRKNIKKKEEGYGLYDKSVLILASFSLM